MFSANYYFYLWTINWISGMTPKEKAKELVSKFVYQNNYGISEDTGLKGIDEQLAKQCALIAVDECFNSMSKFADINNIAHHAKFMYYEEVKNEIEKL